MCCNIRFRLCHLANKYKTVLLLLLVDFFSFKITNRFFSHRSITFGLKYSVEIELYEIIGMRHYILSSRSIEIMKNDMPNWLKWILFFTFSKKTRDSRMFCNKRLWVNLNFVCIYHCCNSVGLIHKKNSSSIDLHRSIWERNENKDSSTKKFPR